MTFPSPANVAPAFYTSPHDPARIPEIVAALKQVVELQGLEEHEFDWLARNAIEVFCETGATVFREGDPAHKMTILLKGEIQVRREQSGILSLFIGQTGHLTGLLPFSRMKAYGGHGFATAPTWALEFDKSLFPEMLRQIPSLAKRSVAVLLDRVREVTRIEQQAEKLNALGKLAGNLAHELNNPASAAQRAASGMLDELRVYGEERLKLGQLCLSQAQMDHILAWEAETRATTGKLAAPREAEQSSREEGLNKWLKMHDVQGSWHIAPELADFGVLPHQLDPLDESLDSVGISVVLSQFASSIRAERISKAMLDSTARIFDLIRAIKDYSYMDQAPIQEVDIPQSLENTLAMVGARLQHVEVVRDYEAEVPCISAYGGELNQVWTALIENALDAIQDQGRIKLSVRSAADMILVEVWDNGIGIAPELQARIFEPFFTTKAPGHGLGLGLDTVNRIVRIHRGYISVESKPGETCFQVRLPRQQTQAY